MAQNFGLIFLQCDFVILDTLVHFHSVAVLWSCLGSDNLIGALNFDQVPFVKGLVTVAGPTQSKLGRRNVPEILVKLEDFPFHLSEFF